MGALKIMSCGEDCTMRMWEYRPGNDLLQQIDLWENFHRGKHIWSGDVDNVELNIAVTGGADGKVRVHDLTQQDCQKFSLAEISFNISLNKSDFTRDYFELPEFLVVNVKWLFALYVRTTHLPVWATLQSLMGLELSVDLQILAWC